MIDIQERPLAQLDEWHAHNEALLAQVEDERWHNHLWNATLLEAQYHDAEEKREMAASREEITI